MRRYKRVTTVFLAAALAAGIAAGCGAAVKDIGQDEAKKIAFDDAGVSGADTSRLRVEKERDDGMLQYEVSFSVAEKEYSYDIDGSTGDIISADLETTGTAPAEQPETQPRTDDRDAGQNNGQSAGQGQSANVAVSEADAKKAALDRVPGATEQDIRMELDFDDGYYIYEGDIIYNQKEYEFEIDAQTGGFLKWSEERY